MFQRAFTSKLGPVNDDAKCGAEQQHNPADITPDFVESCAAALSLLNGDTPEGAYDERVVLALAFALQSELGVCMFVENINSKQLVTVR